MKLNISKTGVIAFFITLSANCRYRGARKQEQEYKDEVEKEFNQLTNVWTIFLPFFAFWYIFFALFCALALIMSCVLSIMWRIVWCVPAFMASYVPRLWIVDSDTLEIFLDYDVEERFAFRKMKKKQEKLISLSFQ